VKDDVKKPYIYREEQYLQIKIDLPRFAADLAKEFGATVLPAGDYPKERQIIRIGSDDLELNANTWKQRVSASLSAPDVAWGDWSTYDKAQRTDSASVNPDGRSIAAIAKDIKKRVIDASQSALAARRAYAKQQQQNRADIVAKAQALGAACPALTIRVNERDQVATIYSSGLDASLRPTGQVSIRNLGDVSTETFIKIVALLGKEPQE
jgi:hypothetical protein